MNPLVSVVTPCYNAERYLPGFVEQIVSQTHRPIELVLVDDGSTDRTPEVMEECKSTLERGDVRAVLLRQDHAGQAAAINRGLTVVTGDYITWPDVDDLMRPDNLEKKVAYLEEHPEKGLVCCEVNNVRAEEPDAVVSVTRIKDRTDPWLFDRIIRDDGAHCLDIAYLARTSALFDALPARRIFESPAGQNFQLFLPLTYRYPCGYLNEPLVSYVAHEGSHSRSFTTPEQQIQRTYDFEELLRHVLLDMDMSEDDRRRYERYVGEKFLHQRFLAALDARDHKLVRETKRALDRAHGRSLKRGLLVLADGVGLGRVARRAATELHGLLARLRGNERGGS